MAPIGQKKYSLCEEHGLPLNPMKRLSRSQSMTTSLIPPGLSLPPEMAAQWRRRRESLGKLQLDKVAPWMHLHDFSDPEVAKEEELKLKRRESLEKLQLDKVAPWMHFQDFDESEGPKSEPQNKKLESESETEFKRM